MTVAASTEALLGPHAPLLPFFWLFYANAILLFDRYAIVYSHTCVGFFDECHLFDDNVHMCVNEE